MPAAKCRLLLWCAIPLLTALNQICLKILAVKFHGSGFDWLWWQQLAQTPWLWMVIFCEVASFLLWLRILSYTSISKALPLTAISYILVLLAGWLGFGEPILLAQIIGSTCILGGVWLIH